VARINAVRAFNLDALLDNFVSSFAARGGTVNQAHNLQSPFPPKTVYSDTFSGQTIAGQGVIFGGSGFAVNGRTSFEGRLDSDDRFTAGTVTGIIGTIKQGGQTLAWSSIEGISVSATKLQTVARSATTSDDLNLLKSLLAGNDSFDLSNVADLARGYGGNDTIKGDGGADRLYGDNGNDSVAGGSGNDSLYGGRGNDTLEAGTGRDLLAGGVGRDTLVGGTDGTGDVFVFQARSDSATQATATPFANIDTIKNFTRGTSTSDPAGDDIDLRLLDANLSLAGNQAFSWGGTTATANGVWVVDTGSNLLLMADVNGDTTAEFALRLEGVPALSDWNVLL
jgi:Ca2+-binding RTX toxin-like protein